MLHLLHFVTFVTFVTFFYFCNILLHYYICHICYIELVIMWLVNNQWGACIWQMVMWLAWPMRSLDLADRQTCTQINTTPTYWVGPSFLAPAEGWWPGKGPSDPPNRPFRPRMSFKATFIKVFIFIKPFCTFYCVFYSLILTI